MKQKNPYFYTNLLAWGLVLFLIGNYVFGWTTPSANPPSSNLPAPINVSSTEQTKAGNLIVEGVLRLGQFTTAPSGTEGALYFDTTEKKMKIYSDSVWSELGGGAGQLPNYTSTQRDALSPVEGQQIYNTTENKVQVYGQTAWKTVTAKLALAATCSLDGDCDSTHCVDGYCCATICDGNCNRCNIAGSIGTCVDVASDCTGNCDICSSGNCAASVSLCTGNCDICSGSGTAYNCAADNSLCATCYECTGTGTVYDCTVCADGTSGCGCTATHYRCDGSGNCTAAIVISSCIDLGGTSECGPNCTAGWGYDGCYSGYRDTSHCCAGYEVACSASARSCKCWNYKYD